MEELAVVEDSGDSTSKRRKVGFDDGGEDEANGSTALALRECESILLSVDSVEAKGIEDLPADSGPGRLVITTTRVAYLVGDRTFSYDLAEIMAHAIACADESFPKHIYCQIAVEHETEVRELRIFPPESQIQQVFDVMSEAASMVKDEDESEGEELYTGDAADTEQAYMRAARWDQLVEDQAREEQARENGDRYEDAEDEDE